MRKICLLAMSFGAAASILTAQTYTASITGTVIDPAGAVVPQAKITVTDVQRNVTRFTGSDSAGRYALTNLAPGSYALQVEAAGFKKHARAAFDLQVAQQAVIDPVLEVGAITESVSVTGESPLLEARSSSVGKVVESRQL